MPDQEIWIENKLSSGMSFMAHRYQDHTMAVSAHPGGKKTG